METGMTRPKHIEKASKFSRAGNAITCEGDVRASGIIEEVPPPMASDVVRILSGNSVEAGKKVGQFSSICDQLLPGSRCFSPTSK